MVLLTAATDVEMGAFLRACPSLRGVTTLITGVGPVEAAVCVSSYLATAGSLPSAVVNFGVAGAYVTADRQSAVLLDICLAECEVLADLGICEQDKVRALQGAGFHLETCIELDAELLTRAIRILTAAEISFRKGVFATVSCVSGTQKRGEMIAVQHRALCENMEGFAVARACRHFGVPMLELRCISNMVVDREHQDWQLGKACDTCGAAIASLVNGFRNV
ncbi:MAG: futalosine hydrolase [Desulfobulbus sp.]|nr:futalosine hydrolase [Desulfobulbus sp.]